MAFIEFAFIHPEAHLRFCEHAQTLGLHASWHEDAIGTGAMIVRVDEAGLTPELEQQLEQWAQQLDAEAHDWAEQMDDVRLSAAGIVLHLGDGRQSLARIEPSLMRRVLSVLSPEELGQCVAKIVDAVEHPDDRSICHHLHA